MTLQFQAGVTMEIIKKQIMEKPIAKYDPINNEAYLLHSDGKKEKIIQTE